MRAIDCTLYSLRHQTGGEDASRLDGLLMAHALGGTFEHIFKILLIGDAGVGKSSILLRFTGKLSVYQATATRKHT